MSGRGESGRLALSSVDGEAEIGRGKNLENFLLFINPFLREIIADAQHNGEKCAKLNSRIIELAETDNCHVACSPPGMVRLLKRITGVLNLNLISVDCDVGPWGSWTPCSLSCGGGIKNRTRCK